MLNPLTWFRRKTCLEGGEHKFEARYDVVPSNNKLSAEKATAEDFVKIMEASAAKTYVKDVCVHCGKEVKR